MFAFPAIKMKALFMLTVFAANLYAVCHCHRNASRGHAEHSAYMVAAIDQQDPAPSCCQKKQPGQTEPVCPGKSSGSEKPGCPGKNDCSGQLAVKFSLLDKEAVGKIGLSPLFVSCFTGRFIDPALLPVRFTQSTPTRQEDGPQQHAPPDLQALYQHFRI